MIIYQSIKTLYLDFLQNFNLLPYFLISLTLRPIIYHKTVQKHKPQLNP